MYKSDFECPQCDTALKNRCSQSLSLFGRDGCCVFDRDELLPLPAHINGDKIISFGRGYSTLITYNRHDPVQERYARKLKRRCEIARQLAYWKTLLSTPIGRYVNEMSFREREIRQRFNRERGREVPDGVRRLSAEKSIRALDLADTANQLDTALTLQILWDACSPTLADVDAIARRVRTALGGSRLPNFIVRMAATELEPAAISVGWPRRIFCTWLGARVPSVGLYGLESIDVLRNLKHFENARISLKNNKNDAVRYVRTTELLSDIAEWRLEVERETDLPLDEFIDFYTHVQVCSPMKHCYHFLVKGSCSFSQRDQQRKKLTQRADKRSRKSRLVRDNLP